ncbi:MAG: hypothetical protein V3U82_07675 [Robiginitomaculum sp.]
MTKTFRTGVLLSALLVLTGCGEAAHDGKMHDHAEVEMTPISASAPAQSADRLDDREVLPFNAEQRQHVLVEMRELLGATQGVMEGIATGDMELVASAASAVGMKALHTIENKANMQRLGMRKTAPPEFMKLGMGVHKAFDEIAGMAKAGQDPKDIQILLVRTMDNCIACHASYQIPSPK